MEKMTKELTGLRERLDNIERGIEEIKKANDRILSLSFLSAISQVELELYARAGQFWQNSPLFIDALNLAADRARASFDRAESLRQASCRSVLSQNTAIHSCRDQEDKERNRNKERG